MKELEVTKVYDTAYFIERARKIHGDKFDYSKTKYTKADIKVVIICAIHGEFQQIARAHLRGHGCSSCSIRGTVTCTDSFISEAIRVHGSRYDYSEADYKHSKEKLIIICREHGRFTQAPNSHVRGHGCPTCSGVKRSNTKEFVKKAMAVHGDRYDYSRSIYKGNKKQISIVCREHGAFSQRPNCHLGGQGCPSCRVGLAGYGRTSFQKYCKKNRGGLGLMYVIKCFNESESFYKIGITSRTIAQRFHNELAMPYSYEEVYVVEGDSAYIYDLESRLHKMMYEYRYDPDIVFDGRSECFKTIRPVERLLKKLATTEQLQLLA